MFQFKSPQITTEPPLASIVWQGEIDSVQYRSTHQSFAVAVKKTPCKHWILDYQQGGAISKEDQDWTVEVWFPEILGAVGEVLEKIAIVSSLDVFNKVAVRIMSSTSLQNKNFETAFFKTREEANHWLNPELQQNYTLNGVNH